MMLLFLYLAFLISSVRLEYASHAFGRNSEPFGKPSHCIKSAKCKTINNPTCLGTPLPYDTISLDLIPDLIPDQEWLMVQDKLHLLKSLQYIPKCWAVVQPLLCSLYMPKCINDTVELPSFDMCYKIATPCREILNETDIWPNFINCEHQDLFPKYCQKDLYYREIKFNYSGKCLPPLVPTDNSLAMFEGVEGCGYPCSDPTYTQEEKNQIHAIIFWAAIVCFSCNAFTVLTFLIEWRSANKYPALAIFYINCCFMIANMGWLAQFFVTGNRDIIVCRKDGTLRSNEPSGENLWCVVVFVMIYYSMIAAMVWFVILTYSWYMKFTKCYGTMQDKVDKKSAYFHIIAWCLPLIMTVSIMAIGEIDGNHVTGICFVGYNNHTVRACFVILPIVVVVITGGFFQFRALRSLIKIWNSGQGIILDQHRAKIGTYIRRMGLFSFLTLFPIIITTLCHSYDFQNTWEWKKSFRDFQLCSIMYKYADGFAECKMKSRPNAAKLQLHILAPFLTGILMSHWIITDSTFQIWTRFLKKVIKREEEPIKLTKQQVIAQAFARKEMIIDNDGRYSINFQNTHKDPVGLNFNLNDDVAGDYISSSWAAHLPKLVSRRGAICDNDTSEMSNRRNSTDSQYSLNISLCRVALESKRNSFDSQYAQLSISEIFKTDFTATATSNKVVKKGKRRKTFNKRSKRRSEHLRRSRRDTEKPSVIRRASSTSQESQMNVQIMSALAVQLASASNGLPSPNMKRRLGFDQGILSPSKAIKLLPYIMESKGLKNRCTNDRNLCSDDNLTNGSSDRENNFNYKETICDNENNQEVSDNSASEPEEDTKMIEPAEASEMIKSKSSNKSSKSKYKCKIEDEAALQHLLGKSQSYSKKSKHEEEDENSDERSDLASSSSSYGQYSRAMQLDHSNAREMATQTFPMLDMREKIPLCEDIAKIINNRNFSSKGTQMSPQMKKSKKRNNQSYIRK